MVHLDTRRIHHPAAGGGTIQSYLASSKICVTTTLSFGLTGADCCLMGYADGISLLYKFFTRSQHLTVTRLLHTSYTIAPRGSTDFLLHLQQNATRRSRCNEALAPLMEGKEKPTFNFDGYRYRVSLEDKGRYWDRDMLERVCPRQEVAIKGDLKAFVGIWGN
jgi:hypothetical protein